MGEIRVTAGIIVMVFMVVWAVSTIPWPSMELMARESVEMPPIKTAASSPFLLPTVGIGAFILLLVRKLD